VKRVDKSLDKDWGPVKLYRDDIEHLAELILALPDTVGVCYETDEYEFDSLDDVVKKQQTSRYFEIRRVIMYTNYKSENTPKKDVYATVRISASSSHYSYPTNSVVAQSITNQIDQIMKDRQRRFRFIEWPLFFPIIVSVLGAILGTWLYTLATNHDVFILTRSLTFGAIIGLIITFLPRPKSEVIFEFRRSRPSFLARNKDAILLQLIKYAITLVIGYLLGRSL